MIWIRNRSTGAVQEIAAGSFDSALHERLEAETVEAFPIQTRAADVRNDTFDSDARTVEVVFSTATSRVRRYNYRRDMEYLEELSHDPAHVRLERLNDGAPVLNSHQRWSLEDVIGVVDDGSASVDGEQGEARLRFSDRETVAPIVRDVANRILRKVSVGYQVFRYLELPPEVPNGLPIWRAIDWEPMEISPVPIPADAGAGFRAHPAANDSDHPRAERSAPVVIFRAAPAHYQHPKGETMRVRLIATGAEITLDRADQFDPTLHVRLDATPAPTPTPPAHPVRSDPDPAAIAAAESEGVRREATRQSEIRSLGAQLNLEAEFVRGLLEDPAVSIDIARARAIEALAARDEQTPTRSVAVLRGQNEADTRREAIAAALLHRFNPGRYELTEPARAYIGQSLLEIGRRCLEVRGESLHGSRMEIAQRALIGTTDLAAVVENVANKSLRDAYMGAPRTFTAWARRATLPDFKPASRVQFGNAPQLVKVGEHGEFRYAELLDSKETYALITYGRIVSITRKVIVNDDLDALTRIPELYGRASANLESDLVYAILTANAAMADGTALFHADHGNLTGTGTAISIASLGVARSLMRQQTGLGGDGILNLSGRYLIVPTALETIAQQQTAQINAQVDDPTKFNPFAGTVLPVAEGRLDASSALSWYMAADPAEVDTIEYAYLEGEEGVTTESRIGFEVDGVEVKARLDFGAKAIDHRGLYKNNGA